MAYTTLYDVSEQGYVPWVIFAAMLVLVALCIVDVRSKSPVMRYPVFTLVFVVSLAVTVSVGWYSAYYRLATALRESRCEMVEGPLTQLQITLPTTAHIDESFVVAGRRFACSNYIATAGCSPTRSDGGPLRESLPVRIHHWHGEIARLEIASPDP